MCFFVSTFSSKCNRNFPNKFGNNAEYNGKLYNDKCIFSKISSRYGINNIRIYPSSIFHDNWNIFSRILPNITQHEFNIFVANCKCSNFVNMKTGEGNCKDLWKHELWCYVSLPSNCADRIKSRTHIGMEWSVMACKAESRKLVEISMLVLSIFYLNSYNSTAIDFILKQYFFLRCRRLFLQWHYIRLIWKVSKILP